MPSAYSSMPLNEDIPSPEEKKYIVYMHVNKVNGKKYIGITCKKPKRRWNNGKGYSSQSYFYHAIEKYGWDGFDHIILKTGLSKVEASTHEIELIGIHQSNNGKFGYNLTAGGDGSTDYICSEETRQSISKTNRLKNGKPLYKIDKFSGEILARYECLAEATADINCCASSICLAINGKTLSAQGYIWVNVSDYSTEYVNHIVEKIRDYNLNAIHPKPVYQIDRQTNCIINKWDSINAASRALKIPDSNISIAASFINTKHVIAGGFKWAECDLWDSMTDIERSSYGSERDLSIYQIDRVMNTIINRYYNQVEANQELNISPGKISSVLNGYRKSTGGFRWARCSEWDAAHPAA